MIIRAWFYRELARFKYPMARQLPLDLTRAPDFSASSFVPGECNAEARTALSNWPKWANRILTLTGPKGSGKTHLGHIFAHQYNGISLDGRDVFIPKSEWQGRTLWVDNAQYADEFTLFTLINLAITSDITGLLLCDRNVPSEWSAHIPDLQSRLRNVQIARLEEPDDRLLSSILEKLFKDRGLKVSSALISYLLANTDRSVIALRILVADLDHAAAQEKVNVTRSFAIKFLQNNLI